MSRGDKGSGDGFVLSAYVTAAIAEDMSLAREYVDILSKSGITAVSATQQGYSSEVIGVAVMVPERSLEQAQEIIESQQQFDIFLDDAFNVSDAERTDFDDDGFDFGIDF